jgi:hypothetical protein
MPLISEPGIRAGVSPAEDLEIHSYGTTRATSSGLRSSWHDRRNRPDRSNKRSDLTSAYVSFGVDRLLRQLG